MSPQHIELHNVNRITISTVGEPGDRLFLMQAADAVETVTLKMEKEQARVLAQKSLEILESISKEYADADLPPIETPPLPAAAQLQPPSEPLFAVGQIGIGYDPQTDRVVLAVQELVLEETETPSTAQFWITRGQLLALSRHTLEVVEQGRPTCPLCGQPIDADGHFCPPSNGHAKKFVQ